MVLEERHTGAAADNDCGGGLVFSEVSDCLADFLVDSFLNIFRVSDIDFALNEAR